MRLSLGNWKMNTTLAEAQALAEGLASGLASADLPAGWREQLVIGVAPPFPFLSAVKQALGDSGVELLAQDCHAEPAGAFTGAVSVPMLASLGVDRVLVGHSERRKHFGDDDAACAAKLRAVFAGGLEAVLCVGESLEQRDAGEHEQVVAGQVRAALEGLSAEHFPHLAVAYEPVWAIGTGRTATPEDADQAMGALRACLAELYGERVAAQTRILYGGSVKPDNVDGLMAKENIDGALVGGASLKADSFARIVNYQVSQEVKA